MVLLLKNTLSALSGQSEHEFRASSVASLPLPVRPRWNAGEDGDLCKFLQSIRVKRKVGIKLGWLKRYGQLLMGLGWVIVKLLIHLRNPVIVKAV